MEPARFNTSAICRTLLFCLFSVSPIVGQQTVDAPEIPSNFNLDLETAARLRPQLIKQSMPATGEYVVGRLVFDRLIGQLPATADQKLKWELRLVADDEFNAYSSPDGSVYIQTGLARLAGRSAGLWAAILSHEIAHVTRRDWARRYLYQKELESKSGTIQLGNPGLNLGSGSQWADARTISEDFARFCRQLEIEADQFGLTLMARAGYHPAFMPALHHLLRAQAAATSPASLAAMHPRWEERDHELEGAYVDASIEFEHRWLQWYASPGGNPPTLVFTDPPSVRKSPADNVTRAKEWQIQVPMHCKNLVGAVEVVLRANSEFEQRQLTGCTSQKTIVTFTLPASFVSHSHGSPWTDVYVLDSEGGVLARAAVPKFP